MKMTLGDIFGMCSPAHGQPLIRLSGLALPIRAAFKVSRILKAIVPEYESVELFRTKLVQKYGIAGEDGGTTVSEANRMSFIEEFNVLLNEEIEIAIDPLNIEEVENVNLTAQEVVALEKIFTIDNEENI